jgi:hypothetical protein
LLNLLFIQRLSRKQIKQRKMSGWTAYIQTLTDSCGEIRRAAIVGLADGSVWARTEGDGEFKVNRGK